MVHCYRCFRNKIFFKQGLTDWWTSVWGMWQGVSTRMQVQVAMRTNLRTCKKLVRMQILRHSRKTGKLHSLCVCVSIYICVCVCVSVCESVDVKTGNWLSVRVCVRACFPLQTECVRASHQSDPRKTESLADAGWWWGYTRLSACHVCTGGAYRRLTCFQHQSHPNSGPGASHVTRAPNNTDLVLLVRHSPCSHSSTKIEFCGWKVGLCRDKCYTGKSIFIDSFISLRF